MAVDSPRVVAMCGSLRGESRTRVALEAALAAAREEGASTDLLDLRAYDLPGVYGDDGSAQDAEALVSAVDDADALLLGTPNYHGSVSGTLKVALDHCGRDEVAWTPVGLLEVAGGDVPGGALAHLRGICRTLHAWTHPIEVAVPRSSELIDPDGIADAEVDERVRRLGRDLARQATVFEGEAVRAVADD